MPDEGRADTRPPAAIRSAALLGAVAAVAVFALLVSEGAPSGLLRRGPFSSDLFDAQAHALVHGHLGVDPNAAGLEGFAHDGHTYLYFGIVPAVARMPIAALTDRFDGRLTQLSMVMALAVTLWAASRLLWRARRSLRGDHPVERSERWIVGGFVAAVGLSSPLLFLASRPVVYHETELWGAATTLVALEAACAWWASPRRRALAGASVAAAVALSTRASVGGGAVAALALTAALALALGRVPRRAMPTLALAVLAPVVLYASVNQARFGDPFTIPFREQVLSSYDAHRQAALDATGGSLFGPKFAPTALVTYTRPDGVRLQRLFPWITFRESTRIIGDATFDTVDRAASLPVVAPSLVVLALVGVGPMVRRGRRAPWLALTLGAATGLVSTVTIAFIANRYLSDFTPALVIAAAVGCWTVADWIGTRPRWARRGAGAALVGLTALGTLVSLALAIQSQRLFILPRADARHDLVAFQYDLEDWLGGGPPVGVRRAHGVTAPGRRGEVVVLGSCRGLYWSDGTRWWPLELGGADGLVVQGPVGGDSTVLVDAGAWRIVADQRGDSTIVSFDSDDGTTRQGEPVPIEVVDGRPITVAIDRVNSELSITAGRRTLLVAWPVNLRGEARPGDGFTAQRAPTPLCHELDGRLAR